MPHITVKLYPGPTKDQKRQLAREIVKDVVAVVGCDEKAVSVALEEVPPEEWTEKVYKPDIIGREELLVVRPGYNPLEP